jgi:acetate kinase
VLVLQQVCTSKPSPSRPAVLAKAAPVAAGCKACAYRAGAKGRRSKLHVWHVLRIAVCLVNVLALNVGSSSLKWSVLDAGTERTLASGEEPRDGDIAAHISACVRQAGVGTVSAVGHRIVHGGPILREAVLVDEAVRRTLAAATELDPLHAPQALAGIDAARRALPNVPQVAVLDTAFHATIPEHAARYALPEGLAQRANVRKLGFHGLSVAWSVRRTGELLGHHPERLLVCHLGSGSSLTAVKGGRSVDTTMGMTPLDGVMMATRTGNLDPGAVLHLVRRLGMSAADVERALSERSGLLGVSGVSADLREVLAAADRGNERARLAYDMLVYSICRNAGAMIAAMEGLDAIAFTGGAGEGSPRLRADVCAKLGWTGVRVDASANDGTEDRTIGAGTVRALVIHAREDLSVLSEVVRVLGGSR